MSTPNDLTLEDVATQFSNWRSNKKTGDAIPESLWIQVNNLLKTYKRSMVMKRLGLSTKQMKEKLLLSQTSGTSINTKQPLEKFFEIPIAKSLHPKSSIEMACLTLKRGEHILSFEHLSNDQIELVINAFMR
jgi:hypothetical protein